MVQRERTAYDTAHTLDPLWPLSLGIDSRGASVHVCARCGVELPDGVLVERNTRGVWAWRPGDDPGVKKNLLHDCRR